MNVCEEDEKHPKLAKAAILPSYGSRRVVLRWSEVSDPSGIDIYQVRLAISFDNGDTWTGVGMWELDSMTSVSVRDQTDGGNLYHWRVRTRDNAGNFGPYSGFATFRIALP